jgi:DNA-binding transcriptional LysR family regulator
LDAVITFGFHPLVADDRKLRRRIKLRDLDTLAAVAAAGGIRKAAQQLNLSQPAVSKAIAELEQMLGCALLERSRRGVEVTASGRLLIERSTTMFDELRHGLRDLAHLADPQGGELSFGSVETINAGLAGAAIEKLTRHHPRLGFNVEIADASVLVNHFLRERLCELVIARPLGPLPQDVDAEPLFHEQLAVVVGLGHPLARRRKLALADLGGESWILAPNELRQGSPVLQAFADAGLTPPRWRVVTGSLNLRYSLLTTGRFITLMPHSLLRFGAHRAFVKVLPIEMPRWTTATMVLTLKNRSSSPLARLFLETLRELSQPLAA